MLFFFFFFVCYNFLGVINGDHENSKIAVCVAGELRTFLQNDVQDNFRVSVINQIKVDLFFQLSPDFTERKEHNHYDNQVQLPLYTVDYITSSLKELNPVSLFLLKDSDLESHPLWINDNKYANHHLSYLTFRWGLCMNEIEQNEKKRGIKYEFVIRLRPDIIWTCKLPASLNFWPKYDVLYLHDLGIIMHRNHTSLMRLYNDVSTFKPCVNGIEMPEICQWLYPFTKGSNAVRSFYNSTNGLELRFVCKYCHNREHCLNEYKKETYANFSHGCIGPWKIRPEPNNICDFKNGVFVPIAHQLNEFIEHARKQNNLETEKFYSNLKEKYEKGLLLGFV